MKPEEFIKLYEKYISGLCSPDEEKLLFNNKDAFKLRSENEIDGVFENDNLNDNGIKDRVYQGILQTISKEESTFDIEKSKPLFRRLWWVAAAILLLSVSVGILFSNNMFFSDKQELFTSLPITPGKDKAVLILADGSKIQLDAVKSGVLSTEGKTKIRKAEDGTLVYEASSDIKGTASLALNTIVIPRGGKYQVKLPDGSWVWLNSESTLVFPATFSGNERLVELKGEAYFEVAKNKEKPFRVETNSMNIEVLGTHFNISAYGISNLAKTTLLEGSVRLRDKLNGTVVLKPGEQGVATANGIGVSNVKVQEVIAWKNGYFVFRDNTIQEIMAQLARWYDVDVEYRGKANVNSFGGIYSKNKELPELLKSLELTGLVHFKIEGRRIIVTS